ncbi:restriction endonuclease [Mucilaginibacter calamicampi]|uniref:Restriction endonuclease n=1 Tax=Mucilaginibacter calamicampi TaxID=1302352 RepID=A0ABW2YXQ4_9SPHI
MKEEDVFVPFSIMSDYVVSITPLEFEQLVANYLIELGKDLPDFKVTHNEKLSSEDGTYQIDVYATFKAIGVEIKVIIECKRYKSSVKREKVQVLHDKTRALGAHKAIMFSTADYQEGAIRYAVAHGIALVRLLPGSVKYVTNSTYTHQFRPNQIDDKDKFVGECIYDNYFGYLVNGKLTGLIDYLNLPILIK